MQKETKRTSNVLVGAQKITRWFTRANRTTNIENSDSSAGLIEKALQEIENSPTKNKAPVLACYILEKLS